MASILDGGYLTSSFEWAIPSVCWKFLVYSTLVSGAVYGWWSRKWRETWLGTMAYWHCRHTVTLYSGKWSKNWSNCDIFSTDYAIGIPSIRCMRVLDVCACASTLTALWVGWDWIPKYLPFHMHVTNFKMCDTLLNLFVWGISNDFSGNFWKRSSSNHSNWILSKFWSEMINFGH